MQASPSILKIALILLVTAPVILSHSWVERLYVLDATGTVGAPGFPRGNGTLLCFIQTVTDFDQYYGRQPFATAI
jgi:hypothetical protein